jgi:tRNA threonylcarbamoyladenosine biosynthesis protein TsaB
MQPGNEHSLTLALDASTSAGTVALVSNGRVLHASETMMRGMTSERLLPCVEDLLNTAGVQLSDVEAVVCGNGPGSFTSLRIAAGIAKGLCHARGLPLFAVSSLLLVVAGRDPFPGPGRYVATLEAMRDELFFLKTEIGGDGGLTILESGRDLAETVRSAAGQEGWVELPSSTSVPMTPHARGVDVSMRLSPESIERVSLDTWEPNYGRLAEAQVRWEAAHGRTLA